MCATRRKACWGWMTWFICAACTPGLDNYSDVTDLRVLAMQASPPEILSNVPVSLDTNITALVVDPRGGPVSYTWSLCPVQSSMACDDFDTLIYTADANTQKVLRALRAISASGTVTPTIADANAPSAYPIPPFNPRLAAMALYQNDITPAVFAYHYAYSSLLNFGLGAWPTVILEVHSSYQDAVIAQKRVVLGIADYNSIAAPLLADLGTPLCTAPQTPPGCVQFLPKVPNSNPNLAIPQASPGLLGDGTWTDVGPSLAIAANTLVRLRPVFAANSNETYQTLRGTLQGGDLQVVPVTEMLSVSWFLTDGSIESNLTQPLLQPTLENVYTSPVTYGTAPVALWLVARDQRGGESWRSIVIKPPP